MSRHSPLPLKRLARVSLGKMLQSEQRSPTDVQQPYLRAANVQPDGMLAPNDVKTMWFGADEAIALDLRGGDVVVVEGGVGGFGRAAFVPEDLTGWGFQNSINRLRPVGGVDGRYLAYVLIALRASGWIRAYCNIVSMPHLTAEKLADVRVPMASAKDQVAIADYLDRETARIDDLIAEQKQLLSILLSRRVAVVSHCITKPRRTRLRRVVSSIRQGWSPNCEAAAADGITEWGVLKTGCVNGGRFRPGENKRLPEDEQVRPDLAARAGELVVSRASTYELVGSAAVVPPGYPRLLLSDLTYALQVADSVIPEYVSYAFATSEVRGQIRSAAKGTSASMQKLSQRDIAEISIPLPDLEDQRRIVAHLDEQTCTIDRLVDECRELITLLKERRSALITAAVTGQIDVRD